MHSDFNNDTLAGMAEAQQRYSGAMSPAQIAEQYSQLCQVDYSQKSPAQVPADTGGTVSTARMAKGLSMLAAVVGGGYILVVTVVAVGNAILTFCAANFVAVGGGAVASAALLLFFAGKGGGGENNDGGGQKNITIVTTYNINQK